MAFSISNFLKNLFVCRSKKTRWIYLIAAFPFTAFAFLGWEYGAFYIYITPAALCIFQYFYPTLFGWLLFFSLISLFAAMYMIEIIFDIFKIIIGSRPKLLVNANDSYAFVILDFLLIAISYGLFKARPKKKERE